MLFTHMQQKGEPHSVAARSGSRLRSLIGLLALATAVACGEAASPACRVHADCASGYCRPDGTCGSAADASLDAIWSSGEISGPGQDAGASETGALPEAGSQDLARPPADLPALPELKDDSAVAGCLPNHDGVIERQEVIMGPGLKAPFRAALDATVDMAGKSEPDGSRTWDLAGALPGDQTLMVETQAIAGAWYADKFPGASYAARLGLDSDLLGVFEVKDQALLLRGVVSPTDGVFMTRLVYDPPVPVLAFPLQEGDNWSVKSEVTGWSQGALIAGFTTESYTVNVDAHGKLATPYGTFPVLRIRVLLERQVGYIKTVIRSFIFAAECYGMVATVRSGEGEAKAEFTKAAEVRRLAP